MERLISLFRPLPPWQRYAILMFIPALLALYIWFMMLSPSMDERQRLEKDIQNIKKDIDTARSSMDIMFVERIRREEETLKKEYEIKYEELTRLVGEIPSERDVGKVLKSIGLIARRSGVAITQIQVGTPKKVEYQLIEEGNKKLVKEVQKPEEGQKDDQTKTQQQTVKQQPQQPQQKVEGAVFLRSEIKLSLLGNYQSVMNFLKAFEKEGVVSYPYEMSISVEDNKLKVDMSIYLLMKEVKEL